MTTNNGAKLYMQHPSVQYRKPFHVCVEPDRAFQLAVYRQGERGLEKVGRPTLLASESDRIIEVEAPHSARRFFRTRPGGDVGNWLYDWQWPRGAFSHEIAGQFLYTAVYIVVAYEVNVEGFPVDALGRLIEDNNPTKPLKIVEFGNSMTLFVVKLQPNKNPRVRKVAYIVPIATYQAYNWYGRGSFYGNRPLKDRTEKKTVTYRRYGSAVGENGVNGEPIDSNDLSSKRQTFVHWDALMIQYLFSVGCDVVFYTDFDLHQPWFVDECEDNNVGAILSAGHHEYWSREMLANVKKFIKDSRRDYLCFSGNTCFWRVEFDFKINFNITKCDDFNYEEAKIIGTTYKQGAGKWGRLEKGEEIWTCMDRESLGFTVTDEEHWAFSGTSLRNGEGIGTNHHLIGYECDGPLPSDQQSYFVFKDIAMADLNKVDWTGKSCGGLAGDLNGTKCAIRVSERTATQGLVFNVATVDWVRAIDQDANVKKITFNVLKHCQLIPLTSKASEE